MATRTANTGTNNWNTNAAWVGGVQPTNADDVIIPSGATVPIPTSATVQAKSLTVASGATWNMAGSSTLQIGTSTPGAGNVALSISSGATSTGNAGTIQFLSTSATQQTIDSGGKTLPAVTIGATGGSYILLGALTCGAYAHTAGTFDTAGYTVTSTSFAHSSAINKTLTLGSTVWTCTSSNTPWSSSGTNFTLTANTATIKVTPSANQATWTTASGSYYNVENNTTVAGSFLTGTLSCTNFTYTCDASQARVVQLGGNLTCSGTLTVTGNSDINRPTVQSSVLGTARTITAATYTGTGSVDWSDITAAGAASPFVATSGFHGDRLGNTNVTMTTPATQTRDATSGQQWGVAARWTSRVPLPQDNVVFNASSGSVSGTDVLCMGDDLDFTGYTGTLTRTSSSSYYTVFGSVTLGSGMNMGANPNTFYVQYLGRGSHTITSNGQHLFRATSNQRSDFQGVGSTYTLADPVAIHTSSAGVAACNVVAGTLALGTGLTHSIASLASSSTTYVRSITAGAGTIVDIPTTGATTCPNFSTTNLTTSLSTTEFRFSAASASTRTVTAGFVNRLGAVTYTVADSPGILSFSGASGHSIGTVNVNAGHQIVSTSSATLQVGTWNVTGGDFNGQKFNLGQGVSDLVSQPDATALRLTGDITLDYKVTASDWTPAGRWAFGGKINGGLTTGWCLRLSTTGQVEIICGGVTGGQQSSANAVPFADGDTGWVRFQRNSVTGAFSAWSSPDGTTWTTLGAVPSSTAGALVANTTDALIFGARGSGGDAMPAGTTLHRAIVYNALMGTAAAGSSSVVSDARFEDKTVGADSFTESSANAATVSITGTQRPNDGRVSYSAITAALPTFLDLCGDIPASDYLKIKDVFVAIPNKLTVGVNGAVDTGCTNVGTGAAPTGPYIRQFTDVSGTAFPSPTTAGNLLVAAVSSTTASPAWATPSGYTVNVRNSAAGPCQVETYTRVADGTETAFTTTTTGGAVSCKCMELAGLASAAIDGQGQNSATTVTSMDASSSAVTITGDPVYAIAFIGGNTLGATVSSSNSYGEVRGLTLSSHFRATARRITGGGTTNTNYGWTSSGSPRSQLLVFKAGAVDSWIPQAVALG